MDATKLPANAMIQYRISKSTPIGKYNDSLYYTSAQWAALSQASLTAAENARVDAWVAFVQEQSTKPAVKPTKEELETRKAELVKQIEAIDAQIIAVKPDEEVKP